MHWTNDTLLDLENIFTNLIVKALLEAVKHLLTPNKHMRDLVREHAILTVHPSAVTRF